MLPPLGAVTGIDAGAVIGTAGGTGAGCGFGVANGEAGVMGTGFAGGRVVGCDVGGKYKGPVCPQPAILSMLQINIVFKKRIHLIMMEPVIFYNIQLIQQ